MLRELRTNAVALFVEPPLYFQRLNVSSPRGQPNATGSSERCAPPSALVLSSLSSASFGLAIRQPVVEHLTKAGIDRVWFADQLT